MNPRKSITNQLCRLMRAAVAAEARLNRLAGQSRTAGRVRRMKCHGRQFLKIRRAYNRVIDSPP